MLISRIAYDNFDYYPASTTIERKAIKNRLTFRKTMKFLDTIKKHIRGLFLIELKHKRQVIKNENVYSIDGPTNVDIYDIQNIYFKDTVNNDIENISQPLKKLLSTENIYFNGKTDILDKILKDCRELHGALIPLVALGIGYNIDIVGGAIRDIVLNKQADIKDLDILLSVNPRGYLDKDDYFKSINLSEKICSYEGLLEFKWCSEEELKKVNFNDESLLYERVNCLIQICLNRKNHLTSTTVFSKDDRKIGEALYGEDVLQALNGVIKINSPMLNYPIDLLITEHQRENFLRTIDFGICNIGLSYFNYKKEENQLTSFDKIPHNIFVSTSFLKDAENKTLTYNAQNIAPQQIDYSFSNHLPRIVQKYPDYAVKISNDRVDEETKKVLNLAVLGEKLIKDMSAKDTEPARKRNKI